MDLLWKMFIKEESKQPYYSKLMEFIDEEYRNHTVYPKREDIFKALELTTLDSIKCVIIGQDPYFNSGEAQGLAFSVPDDVKTPPSLRNIFQELNDDLGIIRSGNDLSDWAKNGVLLLNRVLTVREGEPNSHKKSGWMKFTLNLIKEINSKKEYVVFILWGGEAKKLEKYIGDNHCIISSPHPSPLSSYRGFFGSKPFSRCNDYLKKQGKAINWGEK